MSRGIVLLAGEGDPTAIVYNALRSHFPLDRVILERPVPRNEFVRKRVKRLGMPTVAGQLAFQIAVVPLLRVAARGRIREIRQRFELDITAPPEHIVTRVISANATEAIDVLQDLDPRVVVVNGTRILSKQVLSCVPATFLNTHAGITPLYRGVHGGYWALVDGRRDRCGVTVHIVDPGIDTGGIVGQATIEPTGADNFVTYPYLQLAAALPVLHGAVRAALEGQGRVSTLGAPEGPSKLWTHPTIWGYARDRIRRGVK